MSDLNHIDLKAIPEHIAIIMDGNGRWAKSQGQDRIFGHTKGVDAVRETLRAAADLKVKFLTLYAFSTENWNRPKEEVEGLMNLLVMSLANELEELNENGVRLQAIGNIKGLPKECQESLEEAIIQTRNNTSITLVLALNYSSKWEIEEMVKSIAKQIKKDSISLDEIDENLISEELTTKEIPDPELLIRTSGEHRVSNFLLWQIAYTEFYFLDIFWPEFGKKQLIEAIYDYQNRERRFGLVSEQLKGA
ncbi:isoprenyl transferase [Crocinitomicaceae bacterium]|jgi:undecaprenyl diphosphate synthase|nr:isoprenyl transferase [Crocinitomicaceae bacterium]MDB4649071.1 isoprenyl transferase [Crocinitomicaceae bacterium]